VTMIVREHASVQMNAQLIMQLDGGRHVELERRRSGRRFRQRRRQRPNCTAARRVACEGRQIFL
jgi:hypothetical protein